MLGLWEAGNGEIWEVTDNESKIWGTAERMGIYRLAQTEITAFSASAQFGPEIPAIYRRTYMLGIAFGPLIAGIAGLFDYDADAWCWSRAEGFKAVKLRKRNKS